MSDSAAKYWLMEFSSNNSVFSSNPTREMLTPKRTNLNAAMSSLFLPLMLMVHKLIVHSSSDSINKANHLQNYSDATVLSDIDVDIVDTVGIISILYSFVYQNCEALHHTDISQLFSDQSVVGKIPKNILISPSLAMIIYDIRSILVIRLNTFQSEQTKWIRAFKCDVKKSGTCAPFSKFAVLVSFRLYEYIE